MCGSRGGGAGGPDPLSRKSQNIVFLAILVLVKLPSQLSILGHNRHASETPFNCPLIVVFE